MYELSIELRDDGTIAITQPAGIEEPSVVLVAPEQVAIVVDWLNEAAARAMTKGVMPASRSGNG
ncbi:hypothetical protein EWM63_27990 [Pseudoduganella lutea]|uniref:Uncharacterized protein n=2 Tax=Pseudoduganella lutea TaxID=321985 RepID=A0A4P6L442_9BURK|nr:hypothetical protein EWM63_27990 [Pseudoduganella lutea]